jgi:AcrR family transcriptional regulator
VERPARADAVRNRAAIIAAARRLFAERGVDVSLHAIGKAAGVGQASLYRHFANRETLMLALYAENFDLMEATSARLVGSPSRFAAVWSQLIDLSIQSKGFSGMLSTNDHPHPDLAVMVERLVDLLTEPLAESIAAGSVDAKWTVPDLVLVVQMLTGALAGVPLSDAREVADNVMRLVTLDHL